MATVAPAPEHRQQTDADALLRRVELRVSRRLDGILQGERRGRRPGPGGEPSITRRYEPGDDVRWIDWALTARTRQATVRVPELEPVLTTWALIDRSPSMAFGTAVRTKWDLANETLAGLGVVLRRRGDRLAVAVTTSGGLDLMLPPRGDRRGLIAAIAAVDRISPVADNRRTDLSAAINALGRVARHRGAVVLISDFPPSAELEHAVGTLSRRHEVIAIELRDPREETMPDLGTVRLRDMETGARRLVDTADPRFRERFAQVAADRAAERAGMLTRAGARHVVLHTDQDWVLPLARGLGHLPGGRAWT